MTSSVLALFRATRQIKYQPYISGSVYPRSTIFVSVMYVSLLLLALVVCCAYAWLWYRGRRAWLLLRGLPTYTYVPILGNLHKLYGSGEVLMQRINEMSEISEEANLPFALWVGPYPNLMFSNPEDIKAITNAFVDKPYYYSFGRPWLGDGLVTAPVPIWKNNIKKLAGTFTSSIVDGYQTIFNAQAEKLLAILKSKTGHPPFNVMDNLAYATLEAICQAALGVAGMSENIVTSEYYVAFTMVVELLIARGLNVMWHLDPIYKLTPAHKEMKKYIAILHNVSETILVKRQKEWDEKKLKKQKKADATGDSSGCKFRSFLDLLLELSDNDPSMTHQQIKSEVDTIIVGGQETVATTIFFTLLMIGCHSDVQDKLYAELKEIFGDSTRPVEKDDLSRMRYCEALILETLRLYPPVPVVMRYSDKELQLSTGCGVNIWGAGRSRRAWGPDALQYRPERWLGTDLMQTHSASFAAFSYGRRSCIGKKYAMAIIKTLLAYIIRELQITSDAHNLKLKVDLATRSVSGDLIQVQLRRPSKLKS